MSAEQESRLAVLGPEELERYARLGFVRLPAAFARETALALQEEVRAEIEVEHGITRDPGSWRPLPRGPERAKRSGRNEGVATARLLGAIGDVLGEPFPTPPRDWGGFLVSFPAPGAPAEVEIASDTWHWDGHPENGGLIVFTLYSEVESGGGATQVLSGSHRLIADFYASLSPEDRARPHRDHRKLLLRGDPWLASLAGITDDPPEGRVAAFLERTTAVRGVPCRVVELLGEPGDAFLCHPGLLHAGSRHGAISPRFGRVKFLRWGGSGLGPRTPEEPRAPRVSPVDE